MSYQGFISPSNSRSNQSFSGSSLPLCPLYSGDHRAQQALYMGCPSNLNQVSFSPLDEFDHQVSSGSLISYQPPTMSTNTYLPTPRIMYPSSTYSKGNPGFYCDLMQNTTHTGSQTNMQQNSMLHHLPTSTHTPTYFPTLIPAHTSTYTQNSYIPSNPTVHFVNLSSSAPAPANSDLQGPPYYNAGLSSTTHHIFVTFFMRIL